MTPNPQDQQRDEENPDDRPQPPQRMNSEERSNEEALRTQARNTMRSLLGSGYVDSYYDGAASDFVGLARWWASVQVAAVERERDEAMNERDAAELMVRRLADQAVSDEARIAAVDAAADEVHGHGADDERAEVERLRGIISRIAALAASPTPSRNDPHAWDGNETCRCGHGRYSALHGMFDLAASPTPTGPEPASAVKALGYLLLCHDTPSARASDWRMAWKTAAEAMHVATGYVGPATPEPTEETP